MMKMLGGAALIGNITKIVKAVDGDATTTALQKIGAMIEGDAKRIITHKNIVDTGRLLGSITYAIDGKQYGFEPVKGSEHSDQVDRNQSKKEVIIGTNVEYAAAQEFGSKKGVAARPYMSVAFNHNKQNAVDLLGKDIFYEITKSNMTGFGVIKK